MIIKEELIKKKILDKDNIKLEYKRKIENVKVHYGIDFNIEYFNDKKINKIVFGKMNYKNKADNITMYYDNKENYFNCVSYNIIKNETMNNIDNINLINELNKKYKIKLAINEIQNLNKEYLQQINKIDKEYNQGTKKEGTSLEINKSFKNE